MRPSAISPGLLAAYRETDYLIVAEVPFTLRIGCRALALSALFAAHHRDCAAFLTACNPCSARRPDTENERAQQALREDLRALDLPVIDGLARDPAGVWPDEPSFLVLGLALDTARRLAGKYRQNAFVWADGSAVPALILMK